MVENPKKLCLKFWPGDRRSPRRRPKQAFRTPCKVSHSRSSSPYPHMQNISGSFRTTMLLARYPGSPHQPEECQPTSPKTKIPLERSIPTLRDHVEIQAWTRILKFCFCPGPFSQIRQLPSTGGVPENLQKPPEGRGAVPRKTGVLGTTCPIQVLTNADAQERMSMSVCQYTQRQNNTCGYACNVRVRVHIHVRTAIHVCMHVHLHVHVHVRVHVHLESRSTSTSTCTCTCVSTYVNMYAYAHPSTCVYMQRERERERERERKCAHSTECH